MLKVLRKPSNIRGSSDKVIVVHGYDDTINAVIRQRKADPSCRQRHDFPSAYYVKVRYLIADDGFISIKAIWVSKDHAHWSCFYNPSHDQEGDRSVCRDRFWFYYLSAEDIDGIYEAIDRYEDDRASLQLASEGPDAFDFVDELAEESFNDFLPATARLSRLLGH
jgi:hypothetical protein